MSDYGRLAYTGLGTISIFGVVINQMWIGALALVLVLAGVAAIRFGWRRGRPVNSR